MIPSETLSLFPGPAGDTFDPFEHENMLREAGYGAIAGTDEAGRGPLAGPVVAAAVILPPGRNFSGIDDSKRMSPRAREGAFQRIQEQALATGIAVVSPLQIDAMNVLRASLEAMRLAVSMLDPPPDFLLVDGIHKVPLILSQKCLKKGDQRSRTIAAASVLAKVYRDRIMDSFHQTYPAYGFDRHKGYGTRAHLQALRRHGPSPIHRRTFKGVTRHDPPAA